MKKRLAMAVSAAVLALGLFGLFGCASGNDDGASGATDGGASASTSPSGEVSVYSREDGSGTRSAFVVPAFPLPFSRISSCLIFFVKM